MDDDWQARADALWERFDEFEPEAFVEAMRQLVAELPAGSAVGAFELAGAYDSTGGTDRAVPLYREALSRTAEVAGSGERATALDASQRRQATIQLASSLRALGHVDESIELLSAERAAASDELDDAVTGFLALALVHAGREREAAALTLTALAAHLPRYRRSLTAYATEL
ncbi:tetratricopeptide repeat protein [Herbiconiux sp. CPCC 203407]|uniref:Tetratricopeptide repeat protein n=1 Tax=Herbiconiux oxytropis TaxID=2970915 RepID=A0AA41XJQ9_9MICO|nr:tetratricopeptide repeat protein [Herbiconiux oxytropis]MCS5723955.1 tetratricopeptide repeat protein [Herbiconiux oxytropis]MCS5728039.1 tetratricopeptide repeat protein [Herbiconiux oxytropis]